MKILVCITHVPDTTSKISFTNNKEFNKDGVQFVIGPYDEYALSKAVDLKASLNAEVTVLNVGLSDADASLRKALAIGADKAVRIDAFPKDSFFVASQIAEYAKDKNFDLILMGRESIDFNGGMVHAMVGELLSIPSVSPIMKLDIVQDKASVSREVEGGKEILMLNFPFVAGCQEPIAEWKIPTMKGIMTAKSKPLEVIKPITCDENLTIEYIYFELPPPKKGCQMIDASEPEKLVYLLKNEAKVI
jgi:electron transfer flavoprotein beta subunit